VLKYFVPGSRLISGGQKSLGTSSLALWPPIDLETATADSLLDAVELAKLKLEQERQKRLGIWGGQPPSYAEFPARAEIVLEGVIDPQETALEGPFGDHLGYFLRPLDQ